MTTRQILQEIHSRFYKAFDALDGWNPKKALPMSCDVEVRPNCSINMDVGSLCNKKAYGTSIAVYYT